MRNGFNSFEVDIQLVIESNKFLQLLKLFGINDCCFLNRSNFYQSVLLPSRLNRE